MKLHTLSLFSLLEEYRVKRPLIEAKLRGESIEGYHDGDIVLSGMPIGMAISVIILLLILWIWALSVLILYWYQLPAWAQIIGVLGLLSGMGPVVTLVVVYIGKEQ